MDTFHMKKAVNSNMGKDNLNADQKTEIKNDLNRLIGCTEPEEFITLKTLIL